MPYLNSLGKWCAGVGGGQASYEGQVLGQPAGGTCFFDDTHVLYQECQATCQLIMYDTERGTTSVASTVGANTIKAGGGVWAAWLGTSDPTTQGLRTSTGLLLPDAGLHAVGPDGAIAIKTVYQSFGPHYVREKNGDEWQLSSGDIFDVYLWGNRKANWTDRALGVQVTGGIPMPILMPQGGYAYQMVEVEGKWYACYANDMGLVIHPAQNPSNPIFVLPEHAGREYGLRFRAVGSKIHYVYALGEGEAPGEVITGSVVPTGGTPGTGGVSGSSGSSTGKAGMVISSEATYPIADAATAAVEAPLLALPAWPVQQGRGRLVHPQLGAFDYETKPDEWVNIDADIIIPPVWASSRTMVGAANVLWPGHIRDVVVEERWKALGGLAMPIGMLRMLYMIWQNPVDPVVGYVEWWPNYVCPLGFKVLPVGLSAGGSSGLVFDDVVNYLDDRGPDGWMTNPVTLTLKLVERITG